MKNQDRQLWKAIRDAMANAREYVPTNGGEDRLMIAIPRAEFDLLYGEVNAKCAEEPISSRCPICSAVFAKCPHSLREQKSFMGSFMPGQEPAAQVLRHADATESWNAEDVLKGTD